MKTITCCLLFIIACTVPVMPARYAVLVGSSTGDAGDAILRYVQKDLSSVGSVLADLCGFDQGNIITLYNSTPEDFNQALAAISSRISKDSDNNLFLLYYSGHADEDGLKLNGDRYTMTALRDRFSSIPSRIRIGIFDACQSGSITRLKGGRLAAPFMFPSDTTVKGQVILSSSSPYENAQESDALKSSVFTFHLINALRGSADGSGDGRVTLSEAYQYAYNRTVASTARTPGGTQHPGYQFSIQGEGEIVLADLSTRTAGIMLGQDVTGAVTVADQRGNIVADMEKEPSSAVLIALNKGEYDLSCKNASGVGRASAEVEEQRIVNVHAADFKAVGPERSRSKGSANRSTHVEITAGISFSLLDLSAAQKELERQYAGYSMFGINPDVGLPSGRIFGSLGFEFWIKNAFGLTFNAGYTGFRRTEMADGSILNMPDSVTYDSRLKNNMRLDLYQIRTGPAIRLREGPLAGLILGLGLNISIVDFTIVSTFTDGLYNVTTERKTWDHGDLAYPYALIGYRYPVLPYLDIGASVSYTLQRAAAELFTFSSPADPLYYDSYSAAPAQQTFEYNLGGFDFKFTAVYRFGRSE